MSPSFAGHGHAATDEYVVEPISALWVGVRGKPLTYGAVEEDHHRHHQKDARCICQIRIGFAKSTHRLPLSMRQARPILAVRFCSTLIQKTYEH